MSLILTTERKTSKKENPHRRKLKVLYPHQRRREYCNTPPTKIQGGFEMKINKNYSINMKLVDGVFMNLNFDNIIKDGKHVVFSIKMIL